MSMTRHFQQAGHPLWLVGGSVRDPLLGRTPQDVDYATSARPEQTVRLLTALGLPVYPIGERFGTIATLVDGRPVEITTFRSDAYTPGSRHPDVRFADFLHEDLARRDFTINAMAMGTEEGTLLDPFGGRQDLDRRLVRAVGDPEERFREDPLRMLRALRFASTLDFWVEQGTSDAIARHPLLLATIARERVRDELAKLLLGPGAGRILQQLATTGLLAQVSPALGRLPGCLDRTKVSDVNPEGDVWVHTTQVVERVAPVPALRLAALYHDVGKPDTRSVEADGTTHFFRHEWVGQEMTGVDLGRLHFDQATVRRVRHLVTHHMKRVNYRADWPERSVRRFLHQVGPENLEDLFALFRADMLAGDASVEELALLIGLHRRCREVKAVLVVRSPLDGDALMARYGRPPGPWIGRLKGYLKQLVLDGDLGPDDREWAGQLADGWLDRG